MRFLRFLIIATILTAPSLTWGSIYEASLEIVEQEIEQEQKKIVVDMIEERIVLMTDISRLELTVNDQVLNQLGWQEFSGHKMKQEENIGIRLPHVVDTGTRIDKGSSRDMVKMVSHLYAELFTDVNILDECRSFRKKLRNESIHLSPAVKRESRSSWNLRFAYKPADVVELTTRINGNGDFLRHANYSFGLNAASEALEELGMRAAYSFGSLDIDISKIRSDSTLSLQLSMVL